MYRFTKTEAEKILANELDHETLTGKYHHLYQEVIKDISSLQGSASVEDIVGFINKYKAKANYAIHYIKKSGNSPKSLDSYLPEIIKARMAISIIEKLNMLAHSNQTSASVKLNFWDGFILQKLLFKRDLVRKPASIFWFKLFWPLITDKKVLMPLVNSKGIYCFYSKKLIQELSILIGSSKCLELGAGDGTLTHFLKEHGTDCHGTDDYSWEHYIKYPGSVEKLGAKEALRKYRPEVVICSWTPPGNTFERHIFETDSVQLYIVIGTKSPTYSGNHEVYSNQKEFVIECNESLSSLLLPPSVENAVYLFRRKVINSEITQKAL
ncbi:hypothetical protein ACFSO7_12840 [Bacillus sp. CGMCC 1.16607]|uniref:hypothetical protein n=1 Tax=Bacillus sp. CGMCC 1.16607 TaxID=3351842 RepID=UPI003638BC42